MFLQWSLVQYDQLPENGGWLLRKSRAPVQTLENLEMKKTLVAIAALSAMSAFAQSSVTMYGIVDGGYSATSRTISGTKTTTAGVGSSAQSSSRLGVKGSEDLGNGMKAEFVGEFGLKVTDASFSGSSNDVNSATFDNRQTNATLSGGFGSVTVGRQYTATHAVIAGSDAGSGNNVIGGTTYVAGNSTTDYKATPFYGNNGYSVRSSNGIGYTTPSFNGFKAGVGITKNDKTDNGVDTNTDAHSMALSYANGPLAVAASYTDIHAALTTASTVSGTGLSLGLMGMVSNEASKKVDVHQKETAFGGTYALSSAKLFANYLKTENTGSVGGTAFTNAPKRTAYELGIQAPVSGTVSVFAKLGKGKTNLTNAGATATGGTGMAAASADSFNFSSYQLGANYAFSKRTNAYLIHGHAKADLTASTDAKATATAVGIRHQF
jgi:predicted porin